MLNYHDKYFSTNRYAKLIFYLADDKKGANAGRVRDAFNGNDENVFFLFLI